MTVLRGKKTSDVERDSLSEIEEVLSLIDGGVRDLPVAIQS